MLCLFLERKKPTFRQQATPMRWRMSSICRDCSLESAAGQILPFKQCEDGADGREGVTLKTVVYVEVAAPAPGVLKKLSDETG